jgi:hypothetical protein
MNRRQLGYSAVVALVLTLRDGLARLMPTRPFDDEVQPVTTYE